MGVSRCHQVALLLLPILGLAATFKPCLPKPAINSTLKDLQGIERRLVVAAGNWDAPIILGQIAQIILNEGIGMDADLNHEFGGSAAVTRAMTGCLDYECTKVSDFPSVHFDFENWFTAEGDMILAAQPTTLIQGFIGYDGQEGLYMKKTIADSIWDRHRIPMAYFKALKDPTRVWMENFTQPSNITIGNETGCRGETADKMRNVGLECDPDGWWYSPGCNNSKDTCIPVLMGGVGWLGLETAQVINTEQLPMAVSFLGWPDSRILDGTVNALFFWWRPDITYAGLGPVERLLFPKHDRAAWSKGVYETDFPDFQLKKFMWHGVPELSFKAAKMFESFTFTWTGINDLMAILDDRRTDNDTDLKATVACEWVKSNENIWRSWFPEVEPCKSGQGRQQDGTCAPCQPGSMSVLSNGTGSELVCSNCTTGRASIFLGGVSCDKCTPGKYASKDGQSECGRCNTKSYADSEGSVACSPCGGGGYATFVTEYPGASGFGACACPTGSYRHRSINNTCEKCPEGMNCLWGSDDANFGTNKIQPMLDPGYWSSEDAPLSIFECIKEKDCPGGYASTCSGGRIGRACARCPSGKSVTISGSERICDDCQKNSGERIALAVGVMALVVLGLAFLHMFVNLPPVLLIRANMSAVFLGGMAITEVLVINIFASLDSIWAPPLSTFFEFVKVFAFDPKLVSFSCLLGKESPVANYVVKLLGVPFAFIFLLIGTLFLHLFPRLRAYTAINKESFINSIGLLLMIFFIAVSSNSLEGFNCSQNPNGKLTLASDQSVLCWEDGGHIAYVVLSLTALLLNPVLFLTISAVVTFNYNRWAIKGGSRFIMSVRFLVSRMNPEVFYFGFWYNMRNFLLTLAPIITSGNFALQVFALMLVFVAWLLIQMYVLPWRFPVLNYFDSLISATNIMLLTCFAMLAGLNSEISNELVGWVIIVTFLLTVFLLLSAGAWKILSRLASIKDFILFLCHPKTGAGLFVRQIKIMVQWSMPGRVFLDVDELDNLDNLNFTVRANTENFLILLTMETFTRLWCGLEIVSASMNNVPILLAQMSSLLEDPLRESFFDDMDNLWAPLEIAELNKHGITLTEVKNSYRRVAKLRRFSLPFDGTFTAQTESVNKIMDAMVICPRKQKVVAAELAQHACIIYDTKDSTQACVARVLHLLLKGARWSSALGSQGEREPLVETTWNAALVFISKGLIKDAVSVGAITVMYQLNVPVVTMLSQEDFPELDKEWVTKLRMGTALSRDGLAIVQAMAPGSTMSDIGNSQEALFKILAWRFNPQESEMLLNVEFKRIVARVAAAVARNQMSISPSLKELLMGGKQHQVVSSDPKAPLAYKVDGPPGEKPLGFCLSAEENSIDMGEILFEETTL